MFDPLSGRSTASPQGTRCPAGHHSSERPRDTNGLLPSGHAAEIPADLQGCAADHFGVSVERSSSNSTAAHNDSEHAAHD